MSLISKLVTATLIASVTLSATPTDKELMKYVKRNIIKNGSVKINSIEILEKRTIPELKGWEAFLTNIHITFNKKDVDVPEMMFINGNVITPVLVDYKTGKNYRNEIRPNANKDYYNKAHLLMGNENAKHKILVFSDPQCPFCQDIMPDIFKAVKKYPNTFALYYYHLPLLRLHPVSGALTRAMHIAQKKGEIDAVTKFYNIKINPKETNEDKIIKAIKEQTGFITTKSELNSKDVMDAMISDEKMGSKLMVSGTPTVYFNGKWDKSRETYKKFIPKEISATKNAPKTK
ncbi:Secreted protein, suppressor for copper-sensitivity ScsC [hydrothermal vent metagenome]|uniref:Secreted protein, suppressor for copper-sensitivity ScsC n=1 Tax=hydrothermal vent metagenome TaxID=652676 RepID=A0A1W1EKH4_9ZZZZ